MPAPPQKPDVSQSPAAAEPELSVSGPIRVHISEDISDLAPGFLANRARDLGRARRFAQDRDFDALSRLGHNLKGTCGSYGFHGLTPVCSRLEASALVADLNELTAALDEMEDYLARVEWIAVDD